MKPLQLSTLHVANECMQGSLHAATSYTLVVKALISDIKRTIKVGFVSVLWLGFCVLLLCFLFLLRLNQDLPPRAILNKFCTSSPA